MDTDHGLDVGTIARRVWEALDPDSQPGPPGAGRSALSALPSYEELVREVERLMGALEASRRVERLLTRRLDDLEQQLQALPALVLRLERWSLRAERRLDRLDPDVPDDPIVGVGAIGPTEESTSATAGDSWLSIRQVAQALDLTPGTVRRYVRHGRLRAVRLPGGRGLRISRRELADRLPGVTGQENLES